MADLVPAITNLSDPATWDAEGLIDALIAHTWVNHTIGVSAAGQSIALTCDKVGEDHTIILRKNVAANENEMAVSIEPSRAIDDGGDDIGQAPTTSVPSAGTALADDWSGERIWDVSDQTPATGSKLWVCEYPDAILIFMTNSANTFMLGCLHAGRVLASHDTNAVALGQDGLGFFFGQMASPTTGSTAKDAFSSDVTGTDNGLLHFETDYWAPYKLFYALAVSSGCDGTDQETTIFTNPHPWWCQLSSSGHGGPTYSGQSPYVGNSKYLRTVGTSATAKTIKSVTASNQGYLHFRDTTTADIFTFLWDKTKTL